MMFRGVPVVFGHLVDDWKQCWKWFSVQIGSVVAIAPVVYENADFLQDFLDPTGFHYLMGILGALALAGRMIKQS